MLNPAAGGEEPIINTNNNVFRPAGIQWDVGITEKYGDARELARQAAEAGYDLVAGYGGDGTQHEIANGLMDSADEAMTRVKERRPVADPYTEHFKSRILKFEEEWVAKNGG